MHACAVRGRAVVGAAPGSWVPEGAGTAVARVLRAEAAVKWGMRRVARVCVCGRGERGEGYESEASVRRPPAAEGARGRAFSRVRGRAHLGEAGLTCARALLRSRPALRVPAKAHGP